MVVLLQLDVSVFWRKKREFRKSWAWISILWQHRILTIIVFLCDRNKTSEFPIHCAIKWQAGCHYAANVFFLVLEGERLTVNGKNTVEIDQWETVSPLNDLKQQRYSASERFFRVKIRFRKQILCVSAERLTGMKIPYKYRTYFFPLQTFQDFQVSSCRLLNLFSADGCYKSVLERKKTNFSENEKEQTIT